MYVKGVKRSLKWSHTFWLITFLIFNGFSIRKSFGKLRLRAFQPYHQILSMSEVLKIAKITKGCNAYACCRCRKNLHSSLLITFLIFNGFSIRKSFGKLRLRAFQPYHQILSMSEVSKIAKITKGCNAYACCRCRKNLHSSLLITFLIFNGFSIRKKFWKAETKGFPTIPSNAIYVGGVKGYFRPSTPPTCFNIHSI